MPVKLARTVGALLLSLGAAASTPRAESTLILESSSANHEIDGHSRLIIRGVQGTISLRLGPEGALRFEGRSLDSSRGKLSAVLSVDETHTLVIEPGSDVGDAGMLLDVLIPPGLATTVEASESKLLVGGLSSKLRVVGEKLEATIRGVQDEVEVDLVLSKLYAEGVTGLVLGATDGTADVKYVYGEAKVDMTGGRLALEDVESLEAYLEGVDAVVRGVKGTATFETLGGKLVAVGLHGGGDFKLEETPLELRESTGEMAIETDAALVMNALEGPLTVRAIGATVKGGQLKGPLRLESDSAAVTLEELGGACEIHGNALELQIVNPKDTVKIVTANSQVQVSGALKAVTIENDYGDVEVSGTKAPVEVHSREGLVKGLALEGPMNVTAAGPLVEASWTNFNSVESSTLHNESGDLRVLLPPGARCFIDASAPHGRVESSLSSVPASDDGHSARGEHTAGARAAPQVKKPTLQVTSAGGNVYLGLTSEGGAPPHVPDVPDGPEE